MIATCPACAKRYRIADDAVPAGGREVRCAACRHGWIVLPDGSVAADLPPLDAGKGEPPAAEPRAAEPRLGEQRPGAAAAPYPPDPSAVSREPVAAGTADSARAMPPPATSPPAPAPAVDARGDDRVADPDPAVSARAAAVAAWEAEAANNPAPRRWGWVVAALLLVAALAAVAVVEFAPPDTFNPPRLGLPSPASIGVADLPPLDLTRVPVVGEALDRLVNPPAAPASPLRVTATGVRRTLANGTRVLTVTGTVANPTDAAVALNGIDAALVDPAGGAPFRWRIAASASVIAAHGSAAFESVAANYPPGATVLHSTPR